MFSCGNKKKKKIYVKIPLIGALLLFTCQISEEGFICEMKTNTISCAQTPGTTLRITLANYGRTSAEKCKHPYGIERLHNNTNCMANNSLSVVKHLCEYKASCTLTADNSIFGEPCYGVYKYLEIGFKCEESGLWIASIICLS